MSQGSFILRPAGSSPLAQSGVQDGSMLTTLDRVLLVVPMLAGFIFGLAPLLIAVPFATFAGYVGNDPFFYRLAGAATLGYGVALAVGIKEGSWRAVRFMVIAVLVFNLASLYACLLEIIGGTTTGIVYLITAASIALVAITIWMLYEHRNAPYGLPDIPGGRLSLAVMAIAVLAATVFGMLGTFLPIVTTHFFGYKGTEVSLYRLAGSATLGYAVMGVFNMRSRNWKDIRLPVLMAIVFNGVSFLAAVSAILQGDPLLMPIIVAVATFAVTLPMIYGYMTMRNA
jgi:hypothetical protein